MNETTEQYEQTYVVLRVQHPKNDHPYWWNWGRMVNALRRDETRMAWWAGEVMNTPTSSPKWTVRMYRNIDSEPLVD